MNSGSKKPTSSCDSCSKSLEKNKNKSVTKRRVIDPISNKILVLCNSCGLRFCRAPWRVKKDLVKVATQEEKDKYKIEAEEFSKLLCEMLNDELACRLYCPVSSPKICRCIQRYITMDNQFSGDVKNMELSKARAMELLELCRSAKKLILEKQTIPPNKDEQQFMRSLVKQRSKDYEAFVFSNRILIKEKCALCERGSQRVLCYSNNFLHKQLKSNSKQESRIVGKKTVIEEMLPLDDLRSYKCCKKACTKLAASHVGLVQSWRQRSLASQAAARQVIAEMMTPAGGSTNCRQFVRYVTGCSVGLLIKVRQELKQSFGFRQPAEHGLKEYWRQKKIKAAANRGTVKCVVRNVKTNSSGSADKDQKVISIANNESVLPSRGVFQEAIGQNSRMRTETTFQGNALSSQQQKTVDVLISNPSCAAELGTKLNNGVVLRLQQTAKQDSVADQQNLLTSLTTNRLAPSTNVSSCSQQELMNDAADSSSSSHSNLEADNDAEQIEIIKIVGASDQYIDTGHNRLVFLTPDGVSVFEFVE